MLGDITKIPDDGLLDLVRLILSRPGDLTAFDRTELDQINREFRRREPGEQARRRQEHARMRETREAIRQAVWLRERMAERGRSDGGSKQE